MTEGDGHKVEQPQLPVERSEIHNHTPGALVEPTVGLENAEASHRTRGTLRHTQKFNVGPDFTREQEGVRRRRTEVQSVGVGSMTIAVKHSIGGGAVCESPTVLHELDTPHQLVVVVDKSLLSRRQNLGIVPLEPDHHFHQY